MEVGGAEEDLFVKFILKLDRSALISGAIIDYNNQKCRLKRLSSKKLDKSEIYVVFHKFFLLFHQSASESSNEKKLQFILRERAKIINFLELGNSSLLQKSM